MQETVTNSPFHAGRDKQPIRENGLQPNHKTVLSTSQFQDYISHNREKQSQNKRVSTAHFKPIHLSVNNPLFLQFQPIIRGHQTMNPSQLLWRILMKNFYPLTVVFLLAATLITSALAVTNQDRARDELSQHSQIQQIVLL